MAARKRRFQTQSVFLRCIRCLLAIGLLSGILLTSTWRQRRQLHLDQDLISAVEKQNAAEVTSLLDRGANANARLTYPDTTPWWRRLMAFLPGHYIVVSGGKENSSVLTLAVRGYEIGDGGAWMTFMIGKQFDVGIIRSLLAHGADPNIEDMNGKTPLHYALENLSLADVQQMVKAGGDVRNSGKHYVSLLSSALRGPGRTAKALFLLQQGMPLEHIDRDDEIALSIAVVAKDDVVVQALLRQGADVNACSANDGNTALMMAAITRNHLAMRRLLEYHPDLSFRNHAKQTTLIVAQSVPVYGQDDLRAQNEILRLLQAAGEKE